MSSNQYLLYPTKKKMKKDNDLKSKKREFMVGDLVLLDSSRLHWLPGKLNSKRTGPFLITQVFPHGAVELKTKKGMRFKVNGKRIKLYFGHTASVNQVRSSPFGLELARKPMQP